MARPSSVWTARSKLFSRGSATICLLYIRHASIWIGWKLHSSRASTSVLFPSHTSTAARRLSLSARTPIKRQTHPLQPQPIRIFDLKIVYAKFRSYSSIVSSVKLLSRLKRRIIFYTISSPRLRRPGPTAWNVWLTNMAMRIPRLHLPRPLYPGLRSPQALQPALQAPILSGGRLSAVRGSRTRRFQQPQGQRLGWWRFLQQEG